MRIRMLGRIFGLLGSRKVFRWEFLLYFEKPIALIKINFESVMKKYLFCR